MGAKVLFLWTEEESAATAAMDSNGCSEKVFWLSSLLLLQMLLFSEMQSLGGACDNNDDDDGCCCCSLVCENVKNLEEINLRGGSPMPSRLLLRCMGGENGGGNREGLWLLLRSPLGG